MKKIINKKNLIYLFLLLLLLLFVGCNGTPPINHAPTITSTPINTATVGLLYTYNVDATDPDGDTLTYALTTGPPGMSINPSTGVISWTPTSAQTGDYNVTVEVTDGEFQDIQSFIVTSQLTVTVGPVHNITQNTTYTTIQAALNAANSGDSIDVADGFYNESITLPSGKVIILESVNGSTSTFIEGVNGSNTVTCNGSLQGTELRGLNISHKTGDSGAGISNSNGKLTITGCTIFGNSATQPGGGIRNYKGTLTIFGSTISYNSTAVSGGGILNDQGTLNITGGSTIAYNSTDYGGGICNYHGTLTIIGESTIFKNSAEKGGGIFNDHGTLTVTGGSTVSENSATKGAGGIFNDHGTLTVTGGSTVSGNSADDYAGGLYNFDGTLTITGSTVSENSATHSGGGIGTYYGTLTITGSTVSDNFAAVSGGGIFNDHGALTITGSTISGNSASIDGGGIYIFHEPLVFVIGGSSSADTANFNTFINNKLGNTISSAQHIRSSNSGDIHGNFPYNYYTP